jgi:F-type H+-transporting ATPase subunit b
MFLLWKFAYTPVLKILDERKAKIEQGIKDAEKANKEMEATAVETEKIREKAYKEADEILKNAKDAAVAEAAELVKKASDQADRILKTAKTEAALSKDKVMSDAKNEISDVVILALDKIIGKEFDQDQKQKLAAKAIAEL